MRAESFNDHQCSLKTQDLEAVLWLENYLLSQSRTIVLTSHDQDFLENVVQETIIIRNNNLKYFDGTPGECEIQERKLRKRQMKQTEVLDRKRDHVSGNEIYGRSGDEADCFEDGIDREINQAGYSFGKEDRG